jgi:hypothetical protein
MPVMTRIESSQEMFCCSNISISVAALLCALLLAAPSYPTDELIVGYGLWAALTLTFSQS